MVGSGPTTKGGSGSSVPCWGRLSTTARKEAKIHIPKLIPPELEAVNKPRSCRHTSPNSSEAEAVERAQRSR